MKRTAVIAALITGLVALAGSVWKLLDLRFSAGDVYPASSTFRADPLGARAYHDALDQIAGRKVSRLLEPVRRLGNGSDTTLFLLGTDPRDNGWPGPKNAGDLDDFLAQGGRVVLTVDERIARELFTQGTTLPGPASGITNVWLPPIRSLAERWRFGLTVAPEQTNAYAVAATAAAPAPLSRPAPWTSRLRLAPFDTNWTVLCADVHGPVLAAQPRGDGWLIVATGSRFHSNEALRGARDLPLLTWLPGAGTRLVFDETHLGTELSPGIMTLARRYRLHGLGLGLLVLAALYIWRQVFPLVPRAATPEASGPAVIRPTSADGFVNLLRRAVPAGQLIGECFAAWRDSAGRNRPDLSSRIAAMQDLVNLENARPARERNPVEVYRRLAAILHRR